MWFNFFPKDANFFELFEKQSLCNVQAADSFKTAVSRGVLDTEALARIVKLEAEADESAHAVIMHLNKSFITPFDREDIHSLTKALDDIIDMLNTISNRLTVYKITDVKKNLVEFALVIEAAVKAMDTAVKGLKDMKNYGKAILKTKLLSGTQKQQNIRMEFFQVKIHLMIQYLEQK